MFVNLSALRTRSVALVLGVLVALATVLATGTRAQPQEEESGSPLSKQISAPATDPQTGAVVGTFDGTLEIERFGVEEQALYAYGTVTGAVTDLDGTATTGEVTTPVRVPVISGTTGPGSEPGTAQPQQQQECDILHLTLGPLDLDLLGLQVHLDQVVLDIVAVPGAGNLLGNLLCAVAGLLDPAPPNPLQLIADLLNQILEILRGLS